MTINELYKLFLESGRVEIDTRKIDGDCIYFALKGDRFDGNDFVHEALVRGACFAVTERAFGKDDERIIEVKDCLVTLQDLARHHRRQFDIPFLAVTGSNGKTTTKELLASILSSKFNVHSTKGNFNNHIGVPLTLLSIKQGTDIAIIEMGASKLGDIEELCLIAEPTHGIITNIGRAHLEGFGSFENVKKGKAELFDFLCQNGLVFINTEEKYLLELLCSEQRIISWSMYKGETSKADFKFQCQNDTPVSIKLFHDNYEHFFKSTLNGFHNYKNIISAISIGLFFGVPINKIDVRLTDFLPATNRSQKIKRGNITFILDAYNANPTSMHASLYSFSRMPGNSKVVVLGDMMELGKFSFESHEEVLNYSIELGLENIVTVGKQFAQASHIFPNIKSYLSIEELKTESLKKDWDNKTVLLKGSRAIKLEDLLELF